MPHPPVKKAIIAVAGLGTRFLPATKSIPKEMLPIIDKPVVQYIVEEVVEAGITDIIFVTSLGKRAIEDHFDYNFELVHKLQKKQKFEILDQVKGISDLAQFAYVRQPIEKGDGHAILMAQHLANNEPVVVCFGDDMTYNPQKSALKQLLEVYEKYGDSVIATTTVPEDQTYKYGIVAGTMVEDRVMQMNQMIEKPEPHEAPSREAAVGKYIVTPGLMDELAITKPGKDGEIRLADAIGSYVKKHPVYAKSIEGKRFDCGSKLGLLMANVHFGLQNPEFAKDFKDYLKSLDELSA